MGSRAGSDSARLRRLRRSARPYGLTILTTVKPPAPDAGYMLTVEESRKVVLGDKPPFSATLDAIEAHLDALEAEPEDET